MPKTQKWKAIRKPNCYKVVYCQKISYDPTKPISHKNSRYPKYYSALQSYGYFADTIKYSLYKVTSPSFGSLFVFKELEDARRYIGIGQKSLTIFAAYGENLRKAPPINFNGIRRKFYQNFWQDPEKEIASRDLWTHNYWLADSVILYKTALRAQKK